MIYYVVFLCCFWLLASYEHYNKKQPVWIFSLGLFIAIAGFRVETGWDWMTYEDYFNQLKSVWNIQGAGLSMELGFNFLIFILKFFNLDFQYFLFFMSLLTSLLMWLFFLMLAPKRIAFSIAIMYSFIYLSLNMTMMRQALSCTLMLVALAFLIKNYLIMSVVFWLLSCLIHSSSMIFGSVYFFLIVNASQRLVIGFYIMALTLGVFSFFLQFGFVGMILKLLSSLDLGFINNKIAFYLDNDVSFKPSLGALLYLFFYVIFSIIHQYKFYRKNLAYKVETFFLILICFCMGGGLDFPILWSRVQFISIAIVALILARYLSITSEMASKSIINYVYLTCLSISCLVHLYQLNRPNMEVFFPYNSVIHRVFDVQSYDGRIRYMNSIAN